MSSQKVKVGIVGCGNISDIYLKNLSGVFENVEVAACADLLRERAKAKAEQFPGVRALTTKELLRDKEIEIVVNLTIPKAHYEVALAAVKAGKSVHNEKPLTLTRKEGKALLAKAKEKGVRVGSAPDTFMGAGLQTCRKLIDEGAIGEPVAATAFMMCAGHESWHPDPEFYYHLGGGPMFDMGPYYLTALIHLLGPVKRVSGATRISFPTRTITSEKKRGTVINVEVPTHVAGLMDFSSGAIGTIVTSFDVKAHGLPHIEIYGSKGSMRVPDPNGFGGKVEVNTGKGWTEAPHSHIYAENSRGIGVADLAAALKSGRKHRANGEMAYHVLDIMHAFHDSSNTGKHVQLKSTCDRPASLPAGLTTGEVEK
jgi:predicted dehydrogenase